MIFLAQSSSYRTDFPEMVLISPCKGTSNTDNLLAVETLSYLNVSQVHTFSQLDITSVTYKYELPHKR